MFSSLKDISTVYLMGAELVGPPGLSGGPVSPSVIGRIMFHLRNRTHPLSAVLTVGGVAEVESAALWISSGLTERRETQSSSRMWRIRRGVSVTNQGAD